MSDDNSLSESDIELFRNSVGKVNPVKSASTLLETPKPKPVPRQSQADDAAVLDELLNHAYDLSSLETGEELLFSRAGLRSNDFKRLRRGQFARQASLDLHGYTSLEARQTLSRFLTESRAQNRRCVHIIHGKGQSSDGGTPVIKPLVDGWLRQRHEVLGFCSAKPEDGGTGAVYVLLRAAKQ